MRVLVEVPMIRMASAPAILLAVLLTGALGCLESSGPGTPGAPRLPGLAVSRPVSGLAAVRVLGAGDSATGGVVYVSLAPGSVSKGLEVTIRDQATGQSVTTPMVDGGFDPVALAAAVGDTLVLSITRSGSVAPLRMVEVVPVRRPPTVVRTTPPPGRRDVPLNTSVVIVFSEPIDSATVSKASVQLLRGTAPVAGTARLSDSAQLRVEFRPESLLVSQAEYRLLVTQAVQDVNGEALAASLEVPFSTGVGSMNLVFSVLSAGGHHTCGLTTGGTTYCWGVNGSGQLGDGTTMQSTGPVLVSGGLGFTTVSAGWDHTCGITTSGAAYCWGNTPFGTSQPGAITTGLSFRAVSAGGWHSCAIATDGTAYCFGANNDGQLGDGTFIDRTSPVPVSGGLKFVALSAGEWHTCGLTAAGTAYCWGDGEFAQLGHGTIAGLEQCQGTGAPSCSTTPVAVAGGLAFRAISAGTVHTCGLTLTGVAYCWGQNIYGSLGRSDTQGAFSPGPVSGGLTFRTISAGLQYSCGVTPAGAAYCWGANELGELGSGITGGPELCSAGNLPCSTTPVAVAGGLVFASVSAGSAGTSCGVTVAGVAYCWGYNVFGELGDGTTISSSVPVKVTGQP